jgi:hypothetical protein
MSQNVVSFAVSGHALKHGARTMLITYRGYELLPVKVGEAWKIHIRSGGKPIATTMLTATEEVGPTEAKKIADDFRAGRDRPYGR